MFRLQWAEGEIQVNAYKPSHKEDAKQPFKRKQLFSIRWNRELNVVAVYCMQHRSGPKLSSLTQVGNILNIKNNFVNIIHDTGY